MDKEEFEKIRDAVEARLIRGRRRNRVLKGLLDIENFSKKDLGIKATARFYETKDHSSDEIQKLIDKAGASVKFQETGEDRKVNNFVGEILSKGFYGYLKLRRMLGLHVHSFSISPSNSKYLNDCLALINPGALIWGEAGVYERSQAIDLNNAHSVMLAGVPAGDYPYTNPTYGTVFKFTNTSGPCIRAIGTGNEETQVHKGLGLENLLIKCDGVGGGDPGIIHVNYGRVWRLNNLVICGRNKGKRGIYMQNTGVGWATNMLIKDCRGEGYGFSGCFDILGDNLDIFGNCQSEGAGELSISSGTSIQLGHLHVGGGGRNSLNIYDGHGIFCSGTFYDAGGDNQYSNVMVGGADTKDVTIVGDVPIIGETAKPQYGVCFNNDVSNCIFVGTIEPSGWQGNDTSLDIYNTTNCAIIWGGKIKASVIVYGNQSIDGNAELIGSGRILSLNNNRLRGILQQATNPALADLSDGEIRLVHTASNRVYFRINGVLYYIALTAA